MATIVLGALGTLVGGPLGGMIGALAGRQIDGAIIGSPQREGPRLKELAVTASSYGQPIARHYGRMRAAGTIIWTTDLAEQRSTDGGEKGRPSVTSYSYSISFAVALASRPIDRVGRIWADGNLLRGAGGDLKTGGMLRIYEGLADQAPDPLMKAALGAECPAHRGLAYCVFEDLQLEDFGNRIPALSFEVFAGSGARLVSALLEDRAATVGEAEFPELEGFSYDGGTLGQVAGLVDRLNPLFPTSRGGMLHLSNTPTAPAEPPLLPAAAAWQDGDFGQVDGNGYARKSDSDRALWALRYYDVARDYQPSLQRAAGQSGERQERTIEFPGAFAAGDARTLASRAATRSSFRREALSRRIAELDPALGPGSVVRVPGESGLWQVAAWEWRPGGIELELIRHLEIAVGPGIADPGRGWEPPDRLPQPSTLRVFETPWNGIGSSEVRTVYAAASAPAGKWSGAALYGVEGTALVETGLSISERAIGGVLAEPLGPSRSLRYEPGSSLVVALHDSDAALAGTDVEGPARGSNRLLVGAEVLQFTGAQPLGGGVWRLSGLLRGRGGTEIAAQSEKNAGEAVTYLDDRLLPVDPGLVADGSGKEFAVIGLADPAPVRATLENAGVSRRPLTPVHPRVIATGGGAAMLKWTRRARGGWAWLDEVEQPLVEQAESYEVGLGPVAAPVRRWTVSAASLEIGAAEFASLSAAYPGAELWVRQQGSYAKSPPLLLTRLN